MYKMAYLNKKCPISYDMGIIDEVGMAMLIASNDDGESYCILVAICLDDIGYRLYAYCTKSKISQKQDKWILAQFKNLNVKVHKVEHTKDYRHSQCIRHSNIGHVERRDILDLVSTPRYVYSVS